MAQGVAQAGQVAAKGVEGIGAGADGSAKKLDAATRSIIGSIQRTTAIMEAGERGSTKYYEALAAQRGVPADALRPYLTQLDAVAAKQAQATSALKSSGIQFNEYGLSVKQTSAALRQVPAQFTDIITSLQGGQAPLTVLLQQGGQLKDVFGGVVPAAKALGGFVLGLINPFTLAAAAIGVTAYALSSGSKELREFQNAATISGNAIGQNVSQFTALRDSLQGIAGTKGKAAEALTEIASNGKLAGENIKGIAEAAILMEKATGQAIGKTVSEFAKLAEAPLTASLELNKQYNYLTASVYSQIKALEDQGKATQAAEVAEKSFAETLKSRATTVIQSAGLMERAWRGLTGAAKGAWDAMLNVGREDSLAEKLAKAAGDVARVQAQLAGIGTFGETGGGAATGGASAARKAALQHDLAALQQTQRELLRKGEIEQANADSATEANRVRQRSLDATVAFDKLKEQSLTKQEKLVKEIAQAERDGLDAGKSRAEIEKVIASIRERNKGGGSGAAGVGENEVAGINARIKAQNEYLSRLKEQGLEADKLTEGEKLALKIQGELKTGISGVARARKEDALVAAQQLAVLDKTVAAEQRRLKAAEQFEDQRDRYLAGQENEVLKIEQKAQALEDEISVYGLGAQAIAALTIARLEEQRAILSGFTGSEAEIDRINREIEARKRLAAGIDKKDSLEEAARVAKKTQEEQVRMLESTDDTARRVFADIATNGGNAFEAIGKSIKANVIDMLYKMTLRPFVIQMVGAVTGSSQGAVQQAIGGQQQGGGIMGLANNASSLNSLYSAGSQFLTGGSAGASAASLGYANAIGAFGGDAIGALATANGGWAGVSTGAALTEAYGAAVAVEAGTAAGAAAGGAAATAGAAGATAGVTSALAAVPGWGWAALAGAAILGMSDSGGGPKTESGGGYGIGGYMNNGGPTADYAKGIETGYASLAQQLGLTSTLSVGAFSSQDTQGDSMTQLVVNAGLNGQSIYDRGARLGGVENVGRSDGELQAAMTEEVTRVMIAALKASDLEQDYKDFLNTVSDSATAAALESAVNRIIAVKGFKDAIEKLPFENLKDLSFAAADGLIAAAGGLQALSANLDTYYQNFYTAEEQRAQVIKNLFSSLGAAGVDASSIYDPTLAGFRKLVDAQDVTTESGQKAYAALLSVSGAFAQLATSMTAADAGVVAATATLKKAMTDAVSAQADVVKGLQQAKISVLSESLGKLFDLDSALRSATESVRGGPDRATAQGQIAAALATARAGGGLPSSESIAPALRALAASGEDTFRTLADYRRDQAITAGNLTALEALTGDQISIEQKQLDAVNAQLDALNNVNTSVLSVADATANLAAIDAKLATEQTALTVAQAQLNAAFGTQDAVITVAEAMAGLSAALGVQEAARAAEAAAATQAAAAGRAEAAARDAINAARAAYTYIAAVPPPPPVYIGEDGKPGWMPSFDAGINSVPYDMTARIHKDERIMPAADNRELMARLSNPQPNNAELVAEMRALRQEVATLRASSEDTARTSRKTADTLVNVTRGGNAMLTEAA